jgi:TldD protein
MRTTAAIDEPFFSLPLHDIADAALSRALERGAAHADVRCERIRTAQLATRDGRLDGAIDATDLGMSVRVVCDGSWGFASGVDVTPDEAARLAAVAVDLARLSGAIRGKRVELAAEPVYRDARWASDCEINPFDVPDSDKFALLADWSGRLLAAPGINHVYAKVRAAQDDKFYADVYGSTITQQRIRVYPQITAMTVDASNGGAFETMRSLGPPAGRGWEYVHGRGWNWDEELAAMPELLREKVHAPSVVPGTCDLVIDPSNLWLTIHESIGHATELDRVLGHEAAYAGTSFATVDKLGTFRYGSPAMTVTGDRTAPHGLATIGYDDEGVRAGSWDIIRDGILVGYQLDRCMAALMGADRSNGCASADSPHHVALQRMPNVSLQPAVADTSTDDLIAAAGDGLYIAGDNNWSIDMQRYNFQFTAQRVFRIAHGRLAGQVRDVAYQGNTTEFWRSLEAVGGPATYRLFGADMCGKGQPVQVAATSHGCPCALFRNVRVLNVLHEAGR